MKIQKYNQAVHIFPPEMTVSFHHFSPEYLNYWDLVWSPYHSQSRKVPRPLFAKEKLCSGRAGMLDGQGVTW